MKLYTRKVNFFTKRKILKIFEIALRKTGNISDIEVSLSFVDEDEIRRLNKEKRNIDKVTDVLSFPMTEIKAGEKIESFRDDFLGNIYLGDIAICTKRAKEQAKEYGHSFGREICFLALHGLLHIMGYDHMTKKDEKVMMGLAEDILKEVNMGRKK